MLPIPVRLSTLVDPFQPSEEVSKASLRATEIALRYEYPLGIDDQGVLVAREPWIGVAEKLSDKGLLLLRVSITSLDEQVSRVLEPRAPPPSKRLSLLKEFADTGVPGVVRLSPYIPRISALPSLKELTAQLRDSGAKLVIAESLRLESERMPVILRRIGVKDVELEPYSLREVPGAKPLSRPSLRIRLEEYTSLAKAVAKEGMEFATCKEELYNLHTAPNCCGMRLFKTEVGYRPTLYELYRLAVATSGIPLEKLGDALRSVCKEQKGYLCSDKLREYPRDISKPLRYHERKLLRAAKNPEVLPHIVPVLTITNGKIVPAEPRTLNKHS